MNRAPDGGLLVQKARRKNRKSQGLRFPAKRRRMLEQKEKSGSDAASASALRDDEGAIREDFVASIAEAIKTRDGAKLRELAGDLHESDTGDLLEALDPDLRPQLIVLLGADFDFSALTEVDDTV